MNVMFLHFFLFTCVTCVRINDDDDDDLGIGHHVLCSAEQGEEVPPLSLIV